VVVALLVCVCCRVCCRVCCSACCNVYCSECCSVLQRVALCCSVLHGKMLALLSISVRCSPGVCVLPCMLRCVPVRCCVCAVCCSVLHAMGWLRLVGSSKLHVSFAKETYKRYSAEETYDLKEPTNRSHPILAMASLSGRCSPSVCAL